MAISSPSPLSTERATELRQTARLELSRGNIATAETLCRTVLEALPDDAVCWNMIGVIGAQLGLFDRARQACERALRTDPSFELSADNLAQLQTVAPPPPRPSAGYLLIKAWGQGFWSDVDHVLGQLLMAEITGRTPIVHWGANSRFCQAGVDDAFGLYFEPVSPRRLHDLQKPDLSYWPPKWTSANLGQDDVAKFEGEGSRTSALFTFARTEDVVVSDYFTGIATIAPWIPDDHQLSRLGLPDIYRYLCRKYLCPHAGIAATVARLKAALFGDERILAVHARGTDKSAESRRLTEINQALLEEAVSWAERLNAQGLFLMTDSTALLAVFRERFGARLITLEAQRSATDIAVHFQGRDGHSLGQEIMVDTYLALEADWFLGNGDSNVSAMIAHLRDWPAEAFHLLQPNLHYRRHLV